MAHKRVTLKSDTESYLMQRTGSDISLSDVANEAIERWMTCEREAKATLAGVFSKNELHALLAMGDEFIELASPRDFIHAFETSCDSYNFEEEYDIDKETMVEKLRDLSSVELLVLWDWELLYTRFGGMGRNAHIALLK